MNKQLKVYVVGSSKGYAIWLNNFVLVDDLQEADIVFFTGGSDVYPKLYGCKCHPTTFYDANRDAYEKQIFESINPEKQIALGVCRGSQFLCAMNGGVLVQNCDNHAIYGTHTITVIDDEEGYKEYDITSTHHQMQDPYGLPDDQYQVVGWADRSTKYEGFKLHTVELAKREPEIVIYNVPDKPVCLAIQGHPEMMHLDSPIIEKLNQLVYSLIK